ncbi:MAG: division/cell wall cluster transcriptional repressor MraZ [Nitrospirota bacterium]
MFQGRFVHNIDTKGRVSIPAKFREIIAERYENKLILTNDFDKCIVAYPPDEWEMIIEKVKALPMKKEVKIFQRYFISAAMEGELDRQGRILIPPTLRNHAGLNKEVCLAGLGNWIEIWDRKEWEKAMMLEDKDRVREVLAGLGI